MAAIFQAQFLRNMSRKGTVQRVGDQIVEQGHDAMNKISIRFILPSQLPEACPRARSSVGDCKYQVFLERGLTTNIGLTERMSIFLRFSSIESDSEKYVLKALEAQYKDEQGVGFSPKNEDRLRIAVFYFIMLGNSAFVKPAIETMLIFTKSMIDSSVKFQYGFESPVPTLFTSIPIGILLSYSVIFGKKSLSLEFLKSATMYRNKGTILFFFCKSSVKLLIVLFSFSSFLEIMHTFHPIWANSSQNPSPTPSVPPVTTAHLPCLRPYLSSVASWEGISSLRICHRKRNKQRITWYSPMEQMIVWIIVIQLQNIIVMNKARGHKKDVTRTLKAMRIQQSAFRHYETIKDEHSNSIETKPYGQKILYASGNRKNDLSRGTKKRKYRYDNKLTLENENGFSSAIRQQRSLDVKKENFLKISQKYEEPDTKNPYLTRNKFNSVVKQLRGSSNQPRRLTTQQSIRPEPVRRNFHFKTIESVQPLNTTALIQEAKLMSANGSIAESEVIIQRVLREDPQNKEALYVSGCNNFNQMNYLRCITTFNFLLEIDPVYNKNAYIMTSICYNNKNQKEEAMLRINTCLSHFPDFYEAHFQKAKLLIKNQDLQNAVKSLKKALKLAKQPYECCIKLGQCYERQQMYELALKLYEKVSNHPTKNHKEQQHKSFFLLKKAQCEKKLHKFKEHIATLQDYLQLIDRNTVINISKIQYEIGYSCYKIGDYASASMNLQQVLAQKNKKQSTDALILLTIMNIKKRDFYEAYHCLLRKQHMEVNSGELEFYEKFCEGVLCLMKRKFDIGLEKLKQVQSQVSEICKDQFHTEIAIIYPMYLSYAYFCFGRTDKCIKIYKKLLEQKNPELSLHTKGIEFNLALCEGIQEYKHKKLASAKLFFQKSTEIYSHKPEGFLYLAITLIQLYLTDYNESLLKRAKTILSVCVNNLKQLNNNYSASVFYVKAVLSASMGEWDNAINEIDQSIERAEDNDAKSFYLRGLILACCQNYKQAVGEASIAISLNSKEPAYYLLRSKCQQIEGDGNKAFMDLQQYIALCPDDAQIHKFAGHLLFENGAFEDALQAYDNGQITVDASNFDVFLTRSKTYFLLGEFEKSANDMETANKLRPEDPSISFDICVIKILHDFFQEHESSKLCIERAQKAKEELENLAAIGEDIDYGRIFKKIQICMLVSMLLFFMGKYRESARQFKETLTMKQAHFVSNDSQFEEEAKEKQFFIAQMHYNRAICYLMQSQHLAAIKVLESCKVQPESKTQNRLDELIKMLKGKKQGKVENFEVFSQKNKMSRALNEVAVKLSNGDFIKLKLSVPFPKVQPPQISPKFQIRILREVEIENIEKKPEAPWILREENSIKFTQKIEQFSRLEINNSQISKVDREGKEIKGNIGEMEDQNFSQYENSFQSLSDLKEKLKLDDKIENKLNKILKGKK